jgi:diacylglycerol kinase (ATP)
MMKNRDFTVGKRLGSFRFAFSGVRLLVMGEANAWVHCMAVVLVVVLGFVLGLSAGEWIAVVLACGGVLGAEALNTSIERLADWVSPEYNEVIGEVKDLSAGGVLFMAVAAALVGGIVFVPKLIVLF